jgi:predicted nucleotidyltransferase
MRITPLELENIKSCFLQNLPFKGWKLILFGSRQHDHMKGGDIDLLVCFESETIKKQCKMTRTGLVVALKGLIGDQKIDLVLATQTEINESVFLSEVASKGLVLFQA